MLAPPCPFLKGMKMPPVRRCWGVLWPLQALARLPAPGAEDGSGCCWVLRSLGLSLLRVSRLQRAGFSGPRRRPLFLLHLPGFQRESSELLQPRRDGGFGARRGEAPCSEHTQAASVKERVWKEIPQRPLRCHLQPHTREKSHEGGDQNLGFTLWPGAALGPPAAPRLQPAKGSLPDSRSTHNHLAAGIASAR